MIGQTVGNYQVLKLLGEGGMGAVYLAEHPGIGRKAAVKVLRGELASNEEVIQRFFNEARAANAIKHPGIVEIFDFGKLSSGGSYIIMELLEGDSLASRIKRGGFRIADVQEIAYQTAGALAAAHEKGIVHRDLKPDNIFLVPDQQTPGRELVKILDFGIAKLAGSQAGAGSVRTRTGTVMGTPLYMSPEQCRGTTEVDHRTDIYALGIILYELLCGAPPFVSEGHGELIHMHIAVAPAPPRSHNPGIPADLEAVVMKALAKDPARRFQSMSELQRALRSGTAPTLALDQGGVQGGVLTPSPVAASLPRTSTLGVSAMEVGKPLSVRTRRPLWRVAVPVGALVVAGTLAALKLGGGGPDGPTVAGGAASADRSAVAVPSAAPRAAAPFPAPSAAAAAPAPSPTAAAAAVPVPAPAEASRVVPVPAPTAAPAGTPREISDATASGSGTSRSARKRDRGSRRSPSAAPAPASPSPSPPAPAAPAPATPKDPVPI